MKSRIAVILLLVFAIALASLVTRHIATRPPPSPLTAGLKGSPQRETSPVFVARLERRFPPGTRVEDLIWGLAAEGFVPSAGGHAQRTEQGFPCAHTAHVEWQEYSGRIGGISGWIGSACL